MILDSREFIRLHAGMPEHPKVDPLSDSAFRALIEAWCLCRRTRNDGRIPVATWTKKWKLKARKELIAAGLVRIEDAAAVMHDWLEHQPSIEELDKRRAAKVDAGRKGGQNSGQSRRDSASKPASKVEAPASAEAKQEPKRQPKQTGSEIEPELEKEEEISTCVEISPPVSQRAGKPRGSRAYVDRVNATARSAPAHEIAVAFSNSLPTPIESGLLGKVGIEIDKCLNSGISPKLIADGLAAWSVSDSWSPTQIPNFVHKAATSRSKVGRSKPTERVLDANQAAEELLREVT